MIISKIQYCSEKKEYDAQKKKHIREKYIQKVNI